jgi:hypothetical protein
MMAELTGEEVRFLLQALEQLPVRGREAAKLIVSVSAKLEAELEKEEEQNAGKNTKQG